MAANQNTLFILMLLTTAVLAVVSVFVGVSDVSLQTIWSGEALNVVAISRVPRTLALVLAGASLSVAGLIMQMLAQNRFVEPSTAGTVESASLGLLVVLMFAPGMPVIGKMGVASLFALAGTTLFMLILHNIPRRSTLIVPLVGIMLGNVINATTNFFAYRYDLMQSLGAWTMGDFSGVLRGRYELLWLTLALTVAAYVAADRFTVAGLGRSFTVNLGIHYGRVLTLGLTIVSLVTAVVVVTAGSIPFLGLIIPNLVALFVGDNVRRALPWVALSGAAFVLASDILGRVIRAPYEVPLGTIVGVAGSGLFLYLLLRERTRLG